MVNHPQQNRKDTPLSHMPHDDKVDWTQFYRKQIALPDTNDQWGAACEALWRTGHGFPAQFASAIAHQYATPKSERLDVREAPIGSAVFIDDPSDSNAFGHVVGLWERHLGASDVIKVATNDVKGNTYEYGSVSIVDLGWFKPNWGDDTQFATLWCGDYKVQVVGGKVVKPKPPTGREDTKSQIQRAIHFAENVVEMMHKAIKDNNGKIRPAHERQLHRELADQQRNLRDLRHLLPA